MTVSISPRSTSAASASRVSRPGTVSEAPAISSPRYFIRTPFTDTAFLWKSVTYEVASGLLLSPLESRKETACEKTFFPRSFSRSLSRCSLRHRPPRRCPGASASRTFTSPSLRTVAGSIPGRTERSGFRRGSPPGGIPTGTANGSGPTTVGRGSPTIPGETSRITTARGSGQIRTAGRGSPARSGRPPG